MEAVGLVRSHYGEATEVEECVRIFLTEERYAQDRWNYVRRLKPLAQEIWKRTGGGDALYAMVRFNCSHAC